MSSTSNTCLDTSGLNNSLLLEELARMARATMMTMVPTSNAPNFGNTKTRYTDVLKTSGTAINVARQARNKNEPARSCLVD